MPPFNPAMIGAPSPVGRGGGASVPIGSVIFAEANPDPAKYAPCDGKQVIIPSADAFPLALSPGYLFTKQTAPSSAVMRDMDFGNNRFIAVGDSGEIWIRDNFGLWVRKVTAFTSSLYGVAYCGGSVWVICGPDCIIRSADNGDTWAKSPAMTTDIEPNTSSNEYVFLGIAYSAGVTMLLGYNRTKNSGSTAPLAWRSTDAFATRGFSNINYGVSLPYGVQELVAANGWFLAAVSDQNGKLYTIYQQISTTNSWSILTTSDSSVTAYGVGSAAGYTFAARYQVINGSTYFSFSTGAPLTSYDYLYASQPFFMQNMMHDGSRFVMINTDTILLSSDTSNPAPATWSTSVISGLRVSKALCIGGKVFTVGTNTGSHVDGEYRKDLFVTPVIPANTNKKGLSAYPFMRIAA